MRILLISDVHSNVEALTAVLNHASYDEVLFMGDVVDYGPGPFDAWVLLRYVKAKRVMGNHDVAAVSGSDCRSSKVMHDASVLTRRLITMPDLPKKALESLGKADHKMDLDYGGLRVRVMHAAPGDELYRYIAKDEAAQLRIQGADLLLLGHTHIPYEVKNENIWVVNPGSVGMPRDGDPRASYALLDTDTREVRFERVSYDVDVMLARLAELLGKERPTFEFLAGIFRTGSVS
jgi:putative phosphoesterase